MGKTVQLKKAPSEFALGHDLPAGWRKCVGSDKCVGCALGYTATPRPSPYGWRPGVPPAGEARQWP